MRIQSLFIRQWRNFTNVKLDVPPEASLVCLVGENGTGKSNILELLSAIAHQVGLSPGVETSRGNPLTAIHSIEAVVKLTDTPEKYLPDGLWNGFVAAGHQWDGTLRWESA